MDGARPLTLLLSPLLVGCATTITVYTKPEGAQIYITDYPPLSSMKPVSYEQAGTSPFVGSLDYYLWETFYVWADAPGHQASVQEINNEIKIGPALGGFFCLWPLWIWAWGPDDAPVYLDLTEGEGPEDRP
ncbi:MAG: hypothetical protein JXB39_01860 [Deltaproteobacteria bacterium]|nr:hypothetical protein [Deltaproteobacteria bacterium]